MRARLLLRPPSGRPSRVRWFVATITSPRELLHLGAFVFCLWGAFVAGESAVEPTPNSTPAGQVLDRPTGTTPVAGDRLGRPGPGPLEYVERMPAGFDGTEAGVRAAGVAYASEVEQTMLYLDDVAIDRAERQISAAVRADQLVAQRRQAVDTWRAALGNGQGQLWWVVSPLAAKVELHTDDRARVLVWVSYLVSRDGATAPRVWFGVQAIDLVREGDDWKVWSHALDAGPSPQAAPGSKPSDASDLDRRLAGFQLLGRDR